MTGRFEHRRIAAALVLSLATLAAATGAAAASSGSVTRSGTESQLRTFSFPLSAIDSVGPRDTWLAGTGANSRVFVQHWNGARWRAVKTPRAMYSFGPAIIAASSASNAWSFTLTRP